MDQHLGLRSGTPGAVDRPRFPREHSEGAWKARGQWFELGRAAAREPLPRPPRRYQPAQQWLEERDGRVIVTQTCNQSVLISVGLWGRSASVLAFSPELERGFLEALRELYEML